MTNVEGSDVGDKMQEDETPKDENVDDKILVDEN